MNRMKKYSGFNSLCTTLGGISVFGISAMPIYMHSDLTWLWITIPLGMACGFLFAILPLKKLKEVK